MRPHVGAVPLAEHMSFPERAMHGRWPAAPNGAVVRDVAMPRNAEAAYRPSTPRPASTAPDALVAMVDRFSLLHALAMGAPENGMAYLETLTEALEDGEISDDEAATLATVGETMALTAEDFTAANEAFVQALAIEALDDGKVSRAEKAELSRVADNLTVNPKLLPTLLDKAGVAREQRVSEGLAPLPDDWSLGEPLRVGDKVVFTACADFDRPGMEQRAESLGVLVIGSMSPNVALLVSDGTMDGGKAGRLPRHARTPPAGPATPGEGPAEAAAGGPAEDTRVDAIRHPRRRHLCQRSRMGTPERLGGRRARASIEDSPSPVIED